MFIPLLQTLLLALHGNDTSSSPAEHATVHFESHFCRRNMIKCLLMDYKAQYPTQPPHSIHHAFHGAILHVAYKCMYLSDSNTPLQTKISKVLSDFDIDVYIHSMQSLQ
jgi:hypothetical protein